MNKILKILTLVLVFSGSAYTAEKAQSSSSDYVKDYVSNLTVAKIIEQAPASLQKITTNEEGVQYHFFLAMKNVTGKIPVVCFVNTKSTICKVP